MTRNKALALAIATMGVAQLANATTYTGGTLTQWATYSNNGSAAATLTGTTLTGWVYDDVAGTLTAPGTMKGLFKVGATPLYTNTIGGAVLSTNGGAANATSFTCTEGVFGGIVGASICGNYNFGVNTYDESTTSWGPGLAYSKTIGGDDGDIGPVQNLHSFFDGTNLISFSGGLLTIGNTNNNANLAAATSGLTFKVQFPAVPVPAAAWLFGSALGLLGVARRRTA